LEGEQLLARANRMIANVYNLRLGPVARAWEYWNVRLDKAEGTWRAQKARAGTSKKSPAKRKTKLRTERKKGYLRPLLCIHAT
jgi:hypothetical protein